jgi:hypothetical protein
MRALRARRSVSGDSSLEIGCGGRITGRYFVTFRCTRPLWRRYTSCTGEFACHIHYKACVMDEPRQATLERRLLNSVEEGPYKQSGIYQMVCPKCTIIRIQDRQAGRSTKNVKNTAMALNMDIENLKLLHIFGIINILWIKLMMLWI